jgi:hypothetical protein
MPTVRIVAAGCASARDRRGEHGSEASDEGAAVHRLCLTAGAMVAPDDPRNKATGALRQASSSRGSTYRSVAHTDCCWRLDKMPKLDQFLGEVWVNERD